MAYQNEPGVLATEEKGKFNVKFYKLFFQEFLYFRITFMVSLSKL
jgi:hypothetical protein